MNAADPAVVNKARLMDAQNTAEGPSAHAELLLDRVGPSSVHAHVTRPVVLQLDRSHANTVLDLGCGNGWFTEALVRCGFDATGADLSRSGVALASATYPEVSFRQLDARQPLPADMRHRFDAVVAIELLDHVAMPRQVLRHALTALRPGGLFVTTAPFHGYLKNLLLALTGRLDRRWQALDDHGRLKFFSRETLTALLTEAGLEQIQFETVGRIPSLARSMLAAGRAPMGPALKP